MGKLHLVVVMVQGAHHVDIYLDCIQVMYLCKIYCTPYFCLILTNRNCCQC